MRFITLERRNRAFLLLIAAKSVIFLATIRARNFEWTSTPIKCTRYRFRESSDPWRLTPRRRVGSVACV